MCGGPFPRQWARATCALDAHGCRKLAASLSHGGRPVADGCAIYWPTLAVVPCEGCAPDGCWMRDVVRGRASRMARRCAAAARDLLAAAAAVRRCLRQQWDG
ncbi:hypothetical protein F511_37031 [Dorcoceras hygrometricum]|uniref:Uncharacterized protein n=1 Tax=Dorcoceras hygrometricum TaxID=472368 RepID=A0A2Z7AD00_9LAMI|nr:hypothetical protein F511_37031 [Dorcoceras hygrometricum]